MDTKKICEMSGKICLWGLIGFTAILFITVIPLIPVGMVAAGLSHLMHLIFQ